LSRTIIHSIEEDRFGVVQKDLKLCISKLTRLSIAIDAYVRARGVGILFFKNNFLLKNTG